MFFLFFLDVLLIFTFSKSTKCNFSYVSIQTKRQKQKQLKSSLNLPCSAVWDVLLNGLHFGVLGAGDHFPVHDPLHDGPHSLLDVGLLLCGGHESSCDLCSFMSLTFKG